MSLIKVYLDTGEKRPPQIGLFKSAAFPIAGRTMIAMVGGREITLKVMSRALRSMGAITRMIGDSSKDFEQVLFCAPKDYEDFFDHPLFEPV